MPIPISKLFGSQSDTDIHSMPRPEDVKDMSKGWSRIPLVLHSIPNLDFPIPQSKEGLNDLELVKKCFFKPINTQEFLKLSDEKPFELIKMYCHENNLDYDLVDLDDLNDHFSRLVLTLKFKYNRPRPKKFMSDHYDAFPHNRITHNNTPSYPSGHSAHAYFNCCILADAFPEHAVRLFSLADKVAQSRIDLGKHYPSDVSFGRFIGELAASACMKGDKKRELVKEHKDITREERRMARDRMRVAAKRHDDKKTGTSYMDELCEFLIRSNAIERYNVDIDDAYQASKSFLRGLPVQYCSDSDYVKSHLAALETASLLEVIDTPAKILSIHKSLGDEVMERGQAGVLRPFEHYAGTGYEFSKPNNILSDIQSWCANKIGLFERHVNYECIHPFSDGNGRSGRIILACDLDFDLYTLNNMIGTDYIAKIVEYQHRKA